jgi:hypothetical protein
MATCLSYFMCNSSVLHSAGEFGWLHGVSSSTTTAARASPVPVQTVFTMAVCAYRLATRTDVHRCAIRSSWAEQWRKGFRGKAETRRGGRDWGVSVHRLYIDLCDGG